VLKFKPCHEPQIMRQYEGLVNLLRWWIAQHKILS
jgi:hypothetical protein